MSSYRLPYFYEYAVGERRADYCGFKRVEIGMKVLQKSMKVAVGPLQDHELKEFFVETRALAK